MRPSLSYSEHTETLTALGSYLAMTSYKSRTPAGLAGALGLGQPEVALVLDGFPGVFRRSQRVSDEQATHGQHFYTLHLRYAQREAEAGHEDDHDPRSPLATELVVALFDLISSRAAEERRAQRASRQNRITAIGAWVAAVAAILAAGIAALGRMLDSG